MARSKFKPVNRLQIVNCRPQIAYCRTRTKNQGWAIQCPSAKTQAAPYDFFKTNSKVVLPMPFAELWNTTTLATLSIQPLGDNPPQYHKMAGVVELSLTIT